MDSITQVALGVVTSEVGFRRKLGKRANWLAAASALLPDLDIFLQTFAGEWGFMTVHRGISHSFLFSLLAPFPLAWLFWRKSKPDRSYWNFWACSFAAIFSHLLLDLCTTYGTRLFLPFSNHRFAWDFISVIDLVYSSILILTLIGCRIARKRGGDDGARGSRWPGLFSPPDTLEWERVIMRAPLRSPKGLRKEWGRIPSG